MGKKWGKGERQGARERGRESMRKKEGRREFKVTKGSLGSHDHTFTFTFITKYC